MIRSLHFFGLLLMSFLMVRESPAVSLAPPGGDPILIEAESFTVTSPGWVICPWGSNYFSAVHSNSFLSRQAALSLPAQNPESRASHDISIDQPGRYALLARYEAPFRCESQFEIILEQAGIEIFRHTYGIRNNPKIWAFGRGVTEEIAWPWGANENLVWEGQDTAFNLSTGVVRLILTAGQQPSPAARRNVDAFLLTTNFPGITHRIRNEPALPLDGWLTQAGDLYLRFRRVQPGAAITLTVSPGMERSPGPVHLRNGEPLFLHCDQADFGPWIEVGHLLDTLSEGLWNWALSARSDDPDPRIIVECGQPDALQHIQPFVQFTVEPPGLSLAYDGNLRQTHRLQTLTARLQSFQGYSDPAPSNTWPTRFPIRPPLMRVHKGSPALDRSVQRLASDDGMRVYPDLSALARIRSRQESVLVGPMAHLTPIGSPQMLLASIDAASLASALQPEFRMYADIPAFWPGTTPGIWRRLVFAALARGVRGFDFGDLAPSSLSDTPYPLNNPVFLPVVFQTLRDIAAAEDILLEGQPTPAWAAYWVSETGRQGNDDRPPFAAHRRALYLTLCHAQIPLVWIDETTAPTRLKNCRMLIVTDGHVSSNATRLIIQWVEAGGALLTTAGAGWWNENDRPNILFRQLTGLTPRRLETPLPDRIDWEKQDLPWAKPVNRLVWINDQSQSFAYAGWAQTVLQDGNILARFADGAPAVVFRTSGRGSVLTCNFLPGFSYLKPALPPLPLDRNSDPDGTLNRFPVNFDNRILDLMQTLTAGIERPLSGSNPLVEIRGIQSPHGWVLPLINWSGTPVKRLSLRISDPPRHFAHIFRTSGEPLTVLTNPAALEIQLDLDDADLLILR